MKLLALMLPSSHELLCSYALVLLRVALARLTAYALWSYSESSSSADCHGRTL